MGAALRDAGRLRQARASVAREDFGVGDGERQERKVEVLAGLKPVVSPILRSGSRDEPDAFIDGVDEHYRLKAGDAAIFLQLRVLIVVRRRRRQCLEHDAGVADQLRARIDHIVWIAAIYADVRVSHVPLCGADSEIGVERLTSRAAEP